MIKNKGIRPEATPTTALVTVVTGDLNQADRPKENGLLEFCNLYGQGGDYRMIAMAEFEMRDVERHPVVKEVLKIYKEE